MQNYHNLPTLQNYFGEKSATKNTSCAALQIYPEKVAQHENIG